MRYLPLSDADRGEMLARIGVETIDDLFADVPADERLREPLDLPGRKGELEVERILGRMAAKTCRPAPCRSSSGPERTSTTSRRAWTI